MKNHIKVGGRLLQTNKKFSHLKMKQKDWISNRFRRLYHEKMTELGIDKELSSKHRDDVVNKLYEEIQERDIWIPFGEIKKYCFGKFTKTVNKFEKVSEEVKSCD